MKTMMLVLFAALSVFSTVRATELNVTSYNAGLADTFVNYTNERRDPIIQQLLATQTDVLCLQEVWQKKVRKKFQKRLGQVFPHSMATEVEQTRADNAPTCGFKDLFGDGKIVSCLKDNCSGKESDEFTGCLVNQCGGSLKRLRDRDRQCATSLMAQVGNSTLSALFKVMNPFKAAGLFTYEGSDGLMIFSRYPLKEREVFDMSDISTLSRRRALMATVTKENQEFRIGCTHLTANLQETIPYTGTLDNWENENRVQTQELLNEVENEVRPLLLAGDFNNGPAIPGEGISGEFENNYQKFLNAHFEDPAVERAEPECTYCSTNPLVNEGNDPKEHQDLIIDHVFVKNAVPLSAQVGLTGDLPLIIDGEILRTKYSDHYSTEILVEGK